MKNNKEKWIDEVLQSAKTINAVESNAFLTTRIEAKLQQKPNANIPVRWVYATVVVMMIILFINISIWRNTNVTSNSNAMQQLVQEYGWTSNDLYSNSN